MAEDITAPLEQLGHVTQAIVPPAITGAEITRLESIKALVPRALENLASGIGDLGSSVARLTSQMQEPSQPFVTRDQQGNIQVQPQPGILFGPNADALSHAALHGTVAGAGWRIGEDLNGIQAKHLGDPQGFLEAANGYLASQQHGFAAGGTKIANAINEEARQRIGEIHGGMLLRQGAQDFQNARTAIDTRIDSLSNDMYQLALQGGMQLPQFAQKQAELEGQYGALVANQRYGVPKEQADALLAEKMATFRGASIVGQMDAAYQQNGATAAQKELHDSVGALPDLSEPERAQLIARGNARLSYLQGQNADAIQANQQKLDAFDKLINAGKMQATSDLLQPVIAEAHRTGDTDTVSRAMAIMQTHPIKQATEGLMPAQIDQAHGVAGPGQAATQFSQGLSSGGFTPIATAGVLGNAKQESGLRPTAVGDSGTSFGYLQWHNERWSALENFAANRGQSSANPGVQALFAIEESKHIRTPGGQTLFDAMNSAKSPSEAAQLWTNYFERPNPATANYAGRQAAAERFYGGQPPAGGGAQVSPASAVVSANGVPFTAKQLNDNPYLASELVKATAGDTKNRNQMFDAVAQGVERGLNNHMLPSADNLAMLGQIAAGGTPKQQDRYDNIEARVRGEGAGQQAAGYAGGQALIDQAKANANGADIYHQQIAIQAASARDYGAREIERDPAAAAARIGITHNVLPPIDIGDPGAISAGIAVRGGIARAMMDRGLPPRSAVFPPDQPAVESLLSTGTPAAKAALLDSVAGLPEPIREATMADPAAKAAVLSMAHSGQPQLMSRAYSFLDQEYRRNPMTFDSTFGAGTLKELRNWQDDLSWRTPQQIADREMKADDPATIRAQGNLRDLADESIAKVTGKDIAGKFVSWTQRWNPLAGDYLPLGESMGGMTLQAMRDDYQRAYRESFALNANPTAADKYAMEKISGIRDGQDTGGGKWSVSPASGGRIMAWAPERSPAYPVVNGSKDYISTQAQEFVTRSMQERGVEAPILGASMEAPPTMPLRFGPRPYALVPDHQTEVEMTAGQRPSYGVAVQDPNGRLMMLPSRFAADPDAARAAAQSIPRDLSAMPATAWKTGQF